MSEGYEGAISELNNFRALHYVPLNTFQATLRSRIDKLGIKNAIVAQRIKRLPTILYKLNRFPTMNLNQMQDIGGIRAIVPSINDLNRLCDCYISNPSRIKHQIVRHDDYVSSPKESGYRGHHIVFKYQSDRDDRTSYNGLHLEMQLRTYLQHIWATAVETCETFLGEKLKSSQGNKEWLEFFAMVSSAFALTEGCPPLKIHADWSKKTLYNQIYESASKLSVLKTIANFRVKKIGNMERRPQHAKTLALLYMDPSNKTYKEETFAKHQFSEAYQRYEQQEKDNLQNSVSQVVLVQIDGGNNAKNVNQAYPNYHANLSDFKRALNKIMAVVQAYGAP